MSNASCGPSPFVVSCEHASARVPQQERRALARVLEGRQLRALQAALRTHRGWDAGAKALARRLAPLLRTSAALGVISRLLIDLNRSPGHRACLSPWSKLLGAAAQARLHAVYHAPHWQRIEQAVRAAIAVHGAAWHVACHSFEPALAPERRAIDVGLLYDPQRPGERALAAAIAARLRARLPALRVWRNRPYQGKSDGLPTALRRRLGASMYMGLELECSLALVRHRRWPRYQKALALAVAEGVMLCARDAHARKALARPRCLQCARG